MLEEQDMFRQAEMEQKVTLKKAKIEHKVAQKTRGFTQEGSNATRKKVEMKAKFNLLKHKEKLQWTFVFLNMTTAKRFAIYRTK